MADPQPHVTVLDKQNEDGSLEFLCPDCGRRLKLANGRLEIMVKGDETAAHVGSSGGLMMGPIWIEQGDDDRYLDVYRNAGIRGL